MEAYRDILAQTLGAEAVRGMVSDLPSEPEVLVEMKCFQAIRRIQEILQDETLNDRECFLRIEEIVCCLEDLGLSCGNRHDFG